MKRFYVVLCASLVCAMNVMAQAASDSKNVDCNGSVTIKATPAAGFHFVKWVDGATGTEYTTASLNVSNIKEAKNYTAHFAANEVDFGEGVTMDPTVPVPGESLTLTATPTDDCKQFKEWSDHVTDNPRTITYDGTAPFYAVYEIKTYQVNVGTATGNATQGTVEIIVP